MEELEEMMQLHLAVMVLAVVVPVEALLLMHHMSITFLAEAVE
jgi:hypothetical protein